MRQDCSWGSHWLPRLHRARPSVALDDTSNFNYSGNWRRRHRGVDAYIGGVPYPTPWTLSAAECDEIAADLLRDVAIAVVIPARDEATTVGSVLDAVFAAGPFVREVVVVDDHSSDDTSTVATHHGARVLRLDAPTGKGGAMAVGAAATSAELIVFLDADVTSPSTHYLARLVAPLLARDSVGLVKGYYVRPLHDMPTGGGRVNELTARPALSLLHLGLGEIRQPLAGETAIRREVLEACPLAATYGVEVALLLDVAARYGVESIAQVDLGIRRHRNRPLEELRPMATEILGVILERSGVVLPPR